MKDQIAVHSLTLHQNGRRVQRKNTDLVRRPGAVETNPSAAIKNDLNSYELFFKGIKQNLRIKAFYGTSDNAVKTQLWIAVCVYVLVAIVKKELKLEPSLSIMLQVLSVNVFQQEPLPQLFTQDSGVFPKTDSPNQLILCGL